MTLEDSAKLLQYLSDLMLDKYARDGGVFDTVIRVRK